jgi:hypothetical protein
LIALGVISALLYARGITAAYPLAVGLRTPRIGWFSLSGRSVGAGGVLALVLIVLMLGYALALRITLRPGARERAIAPIIIGGWLVSSGAPLVLAAAQRLRAVARSSVSLERR